ncbi:hypothetical protein I6A60_10855 [Frankia sp. AgB1.9]|uniref:hypothetical protein n=1 Tax=unclassified Frankia TaxID=2632575 RepID=UPI001931E332|nr:MULTISPECIES: hypothetical protein [unclassified Frankia]MBL7491989.1 hypothetical protein [Frankia sp. AgW1.1]MBL7548372.1 hypothetical protein [Frankia sp. AgB1.9]MBL7619080.1 hypothetical protein [Frankia sp. AgB1.8]
MLPREAAMLLRFVQAGQAVAATVVAAAETAGGNRADQADHVVRHWRNELVALAASPTLGGRSARPVRAALGGALQGLLVLSLADLRDVTDETELVRLVARLVVRRDLPAGWHAARTQDTDDDAGPDLLDAAASPGEVKAWSMVAGRVPASVLSPARELWSTDRVGGQRTGGRPLPRALGELPAVGLGLTLLREYRALAGVATATYAEFGLDTTTPTAARAATAARTAGRGVATYLPPLLADARPLVPVPRGHQLARSVPRPTPRPDGVR